MSNNAAPGGQRLKSGRARWLGNLLIVLGIALFGTALTTAITGAGGRLSTSPSTAVTAENTPSPSTYPTQVAQVAIPSRPTPTAAPAGQSTSPTPTKTAAPTNTPGPTPTPTLPYAVNTFDPSAGPDLPHATHIQIPSVGIDTTIIEVGYDVININGMLVRQAQVAEWAAGHHEDTADPGEGGNIVISGHDDWKGEVFRTLEHVKAGDEVVLTTPARDHRYVVTEIHFRKEEGAPLNERLATGMFLAPMPDERVTLVTCWPYGVNDHRLIVVAKPVDA